MELSNIRTGLPEILHVRDMKLNWEQRDDQLGPAYGVFFICFMIGYQRYWLVHQCVLRMILVLVK